MSTITPRLFTIVTALANIRLLTRHDLVTVLYQQQISLEAAERPAFDLALDGEWLFLSRDGLSDDYCFAREALISATTALSAASINVMTSLNLSGDADGDLAMSSDNERSAALQEWVPTFAIFRQTALWLYQAHRASNKNNDDSDVPVPDASVRDSKNSLISTDYRVPAKTAPFADHAELATLATPKRKRPQGAADLPAQAAPAPQQPSSVPPSQPLSASTSKAPNKLPFPRSHVLPYENIRDRLVTLATDTQKVYLATATNTNMLRQVGRQAGQVARYVSLLLLLMVGDKEDIAAALPEIRQIVEMTKEATAADMANNAVLDEDYNYVLKLIATFAQSYGNAHEGLSAGTGL